MKSIAIFMLALFLVACDTPPTRITTTTNDQGNTVTNSETVHAVPNIICKGKGTISFDIDVNATAVAGITNSNRVNANMDCGKGFMYYHPTAKDIQEVLDKMNKEYSP